MGHKVACMRLKKARYIATQVVRGWAEAMIKKELCLFVCLSVATSICQSIHLSIDLPGMFESISGKTTILHPFFWIGCGGNLDVDGS